MNTKFIEVENAHSQSYTENFTAFITEVTLVNYSLVPVVCCVCTLLFDICQNNILWHYILIISVDCKKNIWYIITSQWTSTPGFLVYFFYLILFPKWSFLSHVEGFSYKLEGPVKGDTLRFYNTFHWKTLESWFTYHVLLLSN